MNKDVLVLGIGNECRGDDGAGIAVSRAIQMRNIPNVEVRKEIRDGLALMESWNGFERVLAVDAVSSIEKGVPGAIYRFEVGQQALPAKFLNYSTHAFGLAEAIELARALRQLPRSFVVYGIEGKVFHEKMGLSQKVEKAVSRVEESLLQDICRAVSK